VPPAADRARGLRRPRRRARRAARGAAGGRREAPPRRARRARALRGGARREPRRRPAALAGLRFKRGGKALGTERASAYLDALERLEEAFVDREAGHVHALLDELLGSYAAAYAARKRERSALDFDDLELGARDLLASAPAVAEAYASRFDRIMVDEFQDTNDLQMQLLGFLDRDNVFLVGDELQSIYGFRHADVGVFRAQRRRHQAVGRAPALAQNWRTRPELLQLVNGAWGAGHEAYVPLVPGRPAADDGPRAELLVADAAWDDPGRPGAAALRPRCAPGCPRDPAVPPGRGRAVARRLRALCDAGEALPGGVRGAHPRGHGPARLRARARAGGLRDARLAGRGYWLRQPVQDLTAYLAVLANPYDDLALYGALASPLCGLSSDGLAHVATVARAAAGARGRSSRRHADRAAARDRGARRFVALVAAERAGAPRAGLDEVLERAVSPRATTCTSCGFRAAAGGWPTSTSSSPRRAFEEGPRARPARLHRPRAGGGRGPGPRGEAPVELAGSRACGS
jgi:hypothetical protein